MKQVFQVNGVERTMNVLAQMAFQVEDVMISIFKVEHYESMEIVYVRGESKITEGNALTSVNGAEFIEENTIRDQHPWATPLLPCKALTKKQKEMLWLLKQYSAEVNPAKEISREDFDAWTYEVYHLTTRQVEGMLSSLVVKGYLYYSGKNVPVPYVKLEAAGRMYIQGGDVDRFRYEPKPQEDPEEGAEAEATTGEGSPVEEPEPEAVPEDALVEEAPKKKKRSQSKKAHATEE